SGMAPRTSTPTICICWRVRVTPPGSKAIAGEMKLLSACASARSKSIRIMPRRGHLSPWPKCFCARRWTAVETAVWRLLNELGNSEAASRSAKITLARAEKVLAHDPNNGSAMGHGSWALAALGQGERAKDWMGRALLIDPENLTMRYNSACALANNLNDKEAA